MQIFFATSLDLNCPPGFWASAHFTGIGRRLVHYTAVSQGTSVNTPMLWNYRISSALAGTIAFSGNSLFDVSS